MNIKRPLVHLISATTDLQTEGHRDNKMDIKAVYLRLFVECLCDVLIQRVGEYKAPKGQEYYNATNT